MPVAHAASRCESLRGSCRVGSGAYVSAARAGENDLSLVGIDYLSFRCSRAYVTVVHELGAKRVLFMAEGRKYGTVIEFKANLIATPATRTISSTLQGYERRLHQGLD